MRCYFEFLASIIAIAGSARAQRWGRGPPGGHTFGGFPGQGSSSTTTTTAAETATAIIATEATTATTTNTDAATTSLITTQNIQDTLTQSTDSGSDSTTAQASTTTPPPSSTNLGGATGGVMTISIINSYSVALSLDFESNSGAPTPIGNPTATTIGQAATTAYSYPTNWAGRIYVGKTLNSANSKIEGSVTGPPDMDASYVDGYSVPIICTSGGASSGCTLELFGYNNNYCNQTDQNLSDFTLCVNPKVDHDDGTADPFFAPCAGQAYTFPSDNGANKADVDATINCCIGTACGGGSSKRDLKTHVHGRHDKRSSRPQLHVRRENGWSNPRSHVHQLVREAKPKR